MEFDFKEVIKSYDLTSIYSIYNEDSVEWIEENVRRHLERVESDWKSPLTIPKHIDNKNVSPVVLVRIAGVDGLSFGRYNFVEHCWFGMDPGLKVTGWNYMTKGLIKLLQKFNQSICNLQLTDPEKYYLELYQFCKHTGFSSCID